MNYYSSEYNILCHINKDNVNWGITIILDAIKRNNIFNVEKIACLPLRKSIL